MESRTARAPIIALLLTISLSSCSHSPSGTRIVSIQFQEQYRSYLVHVPPSLAEGAPPLLVLLHDTGSNGDDLIRLGGFEEHADTHGYVVAAPNAYAKSFNEGSGIIGPTPIEVDDVGFIDAVIADIRERVAPAAGAVYLVGMGSGGAMAQRAAIEGNSEIRGFASLGGHLWTEPSGVPRPLDVLLVFGTDDPLNPIAGGAVRYRRELTLTNPTLVDTARRWGAMMACGDETWDRPTPSLDRVSWPACRGGARVTLLVVTGLGHAWPGGAAEPGPGPEIGAAAGSSPIDATALIWDQLIRRRTDKPQG